MGPSVNAATTSQALWLPGPSLLLCASAVRGIKAHRLRSPISARAPLGGILLPQMFLALAGNN
jgi:hypothetical protein